jgi:hypothetical protein
MAAKAAERPTPPKAARPALASAELAARMATVMKSKSHTKILI